MRISFETLKVLSDNGCKKASEAMLDWNALRPCGKNVVCYFHTETDEFIITYGGGYNGINHLVGVPILMVG